MIEDDHNGYDHDAYCHTSYQFMMLVGKDDPRVIEIDLRATNHVFNQSGKTMRSFEVILDSQSTCDVIINKAMVINIRDCVIILVLQTQSGSCQITQIAYLLGVGTVWYYPEGAANILSQYRMVVNSVWDVQFNLKHYRFSSDVNDLAYKVETSEGIKFEFMPTKKGLHELDCSS